MRRLFGIVRHSALILGIVLLHFAVASILPLPWRYGNPMLAILLLTLLLSERGGVVWLAFASHFVIELYATSPFGVLLASGTLSMLGAYGFSRYVFTNKSWVSACALPVIATLLYRALYSILLFLSRLGAGGLPWPYLARVYSWEILLTSIATVLLYLAVARPFWRKQLTLPIGWTL